ncbi:SURF1 family protein [Rubellimicrobium aerolatum]|uniref:SURF1-like protein n=1 Tax=Rubellimicrobium aerolatum TaxID=490979 RepID=A0ABW0SFC9_9RHOB|nr:SURF1 family protein [Rubellimicrobium aerolatum]MBP1807158.1 surfeit locus 1 family protein [Rubellimicrobium aerolatum]
MRRVWFPLVLGLFGVAVLCGLGTWQVQRLGQKEALLAAIAARIGGEPEALPAVVDPVADQYAPVRVTGALGGEEVHVLTSVPGQGPGFRVVSAMTSGDRRLLVDLGFVPEEGKDLPRVAEGVTVTGNLLWPRESDSWTPAPDLGRNIWFARDLPALAEALGTEPVLVVARSLGGAELGTTPLPVDTAGIPNDHLTYAITWFGLAAVWAVMSVALLRRTRKGMA